VKFAFVTPRYGAEIEHGPEHVCRLLAEQVCERHDVDVLTTCARDAATRKNDYAEGADRVRGVLVRRFAATGAPGGEGIDDLTRRLATTAHSRAEELEWLERSSPASSGLVEYIRRHHRSYDALVFFSYRAATTVRGLAAAPDRSVLFPCARLEPALRFGICQETLAAPAAIGYCSTAERRLLRTFSRRRPRAEELVGAGVDAVPSAAYPRLLEEQAPGEGSEEEPAEALEQIEPPAHLSGRGVLFRRRHRLHGPFVLYGGPVESDNGTEELLEYFASFAEQDGDAALVMMGVKLMRVPPEPWLRQAGMLPDRERMAAMEAADVTAVPDPGDLVAGQVLESFAVGTPVLASARNAAAVDHCRRANAGLYYANRDEFVAALRLLTRDARLREALGRNGQQYVQQHFRWEAVVGRFERLVGRVKGAKVNDR
jgi:glycosyltransferase involved in cell wall biosynthesis